MKIAYIVPGSGGTFYCGNCMRDSVFIREIRKLGHDCYLIPLYLPLAVDEDINIDHTPIFFGAVNTYLKQNFPVFRKAPGWVDKIFDSQPVLKFAAKKAGSTRAHGLEEMTISMLKGEHGKQASELEIMLEWMQKHTKPDVIHLSNALLSGMAPAMKEALNVPVVCSFQDEDVWLNDMREPFRQESIDLINKNAEHIDAFVSVSDFYKEEVRKLFSSKVIEKTHRIYNGIDVDVKPVTTERAGHTIGFMSRMNEASGLGILVDAFILLHQDPENKDLKLRITGGKTSDDNNFIAGLKKKIQQNNLSEKVDFTDEYSGEPKHHFYNEITLFSMPAIHHEAFGIQLIEALAAGIPLVQPVGGAFPEIINQTGAGVLYEPNTPEKLANAFNKLLKDEKRYQEVKNKAFSGVKEHFNIEYQTEKILKLYQSL